MISTTNPIQIFQTATGELEIQVDQTKDTIWLTEDQIAILFGKDRTVISKHIKNIYNEEEVDSISTRAKNAHVQIEGNREVLRDIEYFNLDLILSVGYRTNSKQATKFRQWANTVLKDYLVKGYSLNKKLLQKQQNQVLEIKQTLDFLIKSSENIENNKGFVDILKQYSENTNKIKTFHF
jgi:hypothetical protein